MQIPASDQMEMMMKPNNNNNNHNSPTNNAKATAGSDRVKRDEWSEGAVSSLLEAYESKWVLRNRAKLKGHDWEDVARHVSSRSNFTKSPKTQTQCKNKIESMKKRYRSESAASPASSWPLYHRLHLLLRGSNIISAANLLTPTPLIPPSPPPPLIPPPPQNSHGSYALPPKELDGVDNGRGDDELLSEKKKKKKKNKDKDKDKKMVIDDTDSSTPAIVYSSSSSSSHDKLILEKVAMRKPKHATKIMKKKKMTRPPLLSTTEDYSIAGSIRWLAEVVLRSQQARIDMIKDIEKMRAEAEAKRAEMDLKRTQIIANTQFEIAKLFANQIS